MAGWGGAGGGVRGNGRGDGRGVGRAWGWGLVVWRGGVNPFQFVVCRKGKSQLPRGAAIATGKCDAPVRFLGSASGGGF